MRILVTGSEGNIGKKLVPYLMECGHEVVGCDIVPKFTKDYIQCNICNPTDLVKIFNTFLPEAVINLAAIYGRVTCEKSPSHTTDVNISGVNNVIQLCKAYRAKFVYFSSSEIYTNNTEIKKEYLINQTQNNIYGLTKYLGELLVKYEVEHNNLNAAIIRPFTIYDEDETMGEHRSAIIRFAEQLCRNNPIEVHLNSERTWLHISDAVRIIEKVLHFEKFEIINIGSSEKISTMSIAHFMCGRLGLACSDYVKEIDQPSQMSLVKTPDLYKQTSLTGIVPKVSIFDGVDLVINKMKERVKNGINR